VKLLYFAWVRQKTGVAEEDVNPPETLRDVAELIGWLAARGPGYAAAFENLKLIRAAVDQEHVPFTASIVGAKEVAFFPPVTGG
jgi:molybdopterin synthase sulfur carrier subunit